MNDKKAQDETVKSIYRFLHQRGLGVNTDDLETFVALEITPHTAAQVTVAHQDGYKEGTQKTLRDLLLHLPMELSSPKAMRLLNEYAALVHVYADIKTRHDKVVTEEFTSIADDLKRLNESKARPTTGQKEKS